MFYHEIEEYEAVRTAITRMKEEMAQKRKLSKPFLFFGQKEGEQRMKQIEVVAAIVCKDDKIFATQRGYGEWKDWWEFPGGKMEVGEIM